ncbi:G patch domain-containing protein 1-like [Schistocerca gregaria]|uniref:G patch domain-containing protein 1-like n=1 Tax=Schistocerca gregaria TaxID=7010 RepID=UPI00211E3E1F|nr:G patch domain-containing protein 1-like [Schistocerca gregaria]
MIGSLLPELDFSKPEEQLSRRERIEREKSTLPIHKQGVYDSKDRARFHGAFKGGWSAGYYNTVGSKEGFVPATYVSSRGKRAAVPQNDLSTIMDEEDYEEMSIGSRHAPLTISAVYQCLGGLDTEGHDLGETHSVIPGAPVLDLFLSASPSNAPKSLGYRLLQKLGWSEEEAQLREAVNEPGDLGRKRETDPFTGLMGRGLEYCPDGYVPEFRANLRDKKLTDSSTSIIPMNDWSKYDGGRASFSRIVVSEDDEAYMGSMGFKRDFDIEQEEEEVLNLQPKSLGAKKNESFLYEKGHNRQMKRIKTGPSGIRSEQDCQYAGFVKSENPGHLSCEHGLDPFLSSFLPPPVPADYDPCAHLSISEHDGDASVAGAEKREVERLDANKRTEIWNSVSKAGENPTENRFFDKNHFKEKSAESHQDGDSVQQTSHIANASALDGSSSAYLDNPMKQSRYKTWLAAHLGQGKLPDDWGQHSTPSELRQEHEEFARTWGQFQPLSTALSKRFVSGTVMTSSHFNPGGMPEEKQVVRTVPSHDYLSKDDPYKQAAEMGLFGKLTRKTEPWFPSRLLCKRMGIAFTKRTDDLQEKKQDSARVLAGTYSVTRGESSASDHLNRGRADFSHQKPGSPVTSEQHSDDTASNKAIQRPPMDLFKAIFEDDL